MTHETALCPLTSVTQVFIFLAIVFQLHVKLLLLKHPAYERSVSLALLVLRGLYASLTDIVPGSEPMGSEPDFYGHTPELCRKVKMGGTFHVLRIHTLAGNKVHDCFHRGVVTVEDAYELAYLAHVWLVVKVQVKQIL